MIIKIIKLSIGKIHKSIKEEFNVPKKRKGNQVINNPTICGGG